MAQLDSNRYKHLTKWHTYGQSDGLYWDTTNSEIVLVLNDSIIGSFDANGIADLIASETRGDILRRGASGWERHDASPAGQILLGDGTDIVSTAISGASLSGAGALSNVARASLQQDTIQPYTMPLNNMRKSASLGELLPTTASGTDMAIISGTFGSAYPTLQGEDFGGGSTDEECAFWFTIPPEYDSGESVTLQVTAGMLTTVADGSCTLDAECYKADGSGGVGSDLVATAAKDINSLSLSTNNFTITPTGLAAGNSLLFKLVFAGSDTGDLGVMIPTITAIAVLMDIKG